MLSKYYNYLIITSTSKKETINFAPISKIDFIFYWDRTQVPKFFIYKKENQEHVTTLIISEIAFKNPHVFAKWTIKFLIVIRIVLLTLKKID